MEQLDRATTRILGGPFKTATTHFHSFHEPLHDCPTPNAGQLSKSSGYGYRLMAWEARRKALDTADVY